ncbi:MAG: Polysaccharide deacetylase [Clostridia bacterium]|nr:Polysaccharide deacetylase [Clostridia bacterium]
MTLDFSFKKYRDFCQIVVESEYSLLTLDEYFTLKKLPEKFIIIRHDVDDEPEYSLKMAQLERELNIKASYYFRTIGNVFKEDIIKEVKVLGHEVGYHYEVLDETCGDYPAAILLFKQNIETFRKICNVTTIAQHGSPLIGGLNATSLSGIYSIFKNLLSGKQVFTKHVNASIWEKYSFTDFGITGEAYLSMDFNDILYLSDTGMSWNNKYRMKDITQQSLLELKNMNIKNTNDIIDIVEKRKVNRICLLVHPDQWRDNFFDWIKWSVLKHFRKAGKMILRWFYKDT